MTIDSFLISIITLPILFSIYGSIILQNDVGILGPVLFPLTYVFPFIAVILFWIYRQATPGDVLSEPCNELLLFTPVAGEFNLA